jgi:hypothetical protein
MDTDELMRLLADRPGCCARLREAAEVEINRLNEIVDGGCWSCEGGAGTGDILADARKWLADFADSRDEQRTHYEGCQRSWTHSTCLIRKMADEIERLGGLAKGMEAAIKTSGLSYRNTDSGPALVSEYCSPHIVRR